VQAATDAQRRASETFAAAQADFAAARQAVIHFEEQQRSAQEALQAADAALQAVQSEAPRVEPSHGACTALGSFSATVDSLISEPGALR